MIFLTGCSVLSGLRAKNFWQRQWHDKTLCHFQSHLGGRIHHITGMFGYIPFTPSPLDDWASGRPNPLRVRALQETVV